MKSWYEIRAAAKPETIDVLVYDEIGTFGVNAAAFAKDIREHKGKKINLRIHSPGGSILDGSAIFNALKRHKGGVDVYVDGLAASMASVIMLAGDKVHAAENALVMIHNPWSVAIGDSEEMRKTADLMDKMKDGIVNIYAAKTKKDPDEIERMMDEETWFTADEAKAFGFVDVVTERMDIAASAHTAEVLARYKKTPAALTSAKKVMDAIPEPIVEPVVTEPTPEPQAIAPEVIEEISAKLTDIQAKLANAEARATKAEAELSRTQTLLEGLKNSLGIAAARQTPVIQVAADPNQDFINRWNSAPTAAAQVKLFDDNKELATHLSAEGKIKFTH